MKRTILLLAILAILFPATIFAQQAVPSSYTPQLITYQGAPFGVCSVYQIAEDVTNGNYYTCNISTHFWQAVGTGSIITNNGSTCSLTTVSLFTICTNTSYAVATPQLEIIGGGTALNANAEICISNTGSVGNSGSSRGTQLCLVEDSNLAGNSGGGGLAFSQNGRFAGGMTWQGSGGVVPGALENGVYGVSNPSALTEWLFNPDGGIDVYLNNVSGVVDATLTSAALWKVNGYTSNGTFPTITGCGTISATAGGATAGTFTTNTTGTCTAVIPMPTAPHGWVCNVQDITKHVAANIMIQSATATNSCTVTGTTAANDVLVFSAMGY